MRTVSLPGAGDAATIESLPLELLGGILGYIFEAQALGSVVALAQCNRSLSGRVLSILYDNISQEGERAGEEALIWAIENNELGLLQTLLDRGVDANARFHSALPDSIRRDVLDAQGLHRRLAPRVDSHLVAKLVQERIVWAEKCRPDQPLELGDRMFRTWYMAAANGDLPDSLETWERDNENGLHDIGVLVEAARFCCRPAGSLMFCWYSWTALHLATKLGNQQAVETLLSHGADSKMLCQGLCDCLTPTCPGLNCEERAPVWTPVHIAICSGHTQLLRLFLDRGDSYLDVGRNYLTRPSLCPGTTAFHSAALRGDVAACELLLAHHTATEGSEGNALLLEQQDGKGLRPLDWAVAAGHVRTTGRWLLEQGVDSLQHISLNDREVFAPLNLLCSQGRYRDAEFFLGLIKCKPAELNLALQLCFARMWKLPRPYPLVLCSLSHLLKAYMEGVVSRQPPVVTTDGEEALLSLLKQLLAAGPDPNALLDLDLEDRDVPDLLEDLQNMSALHMAASQGQAAAIKLLVAAGGQLELRAAHPEDTTPETEPTPMASALSPSSSSLMYKDPRIYLETIITLLKLGAKFVGWGAGGIPSRSSAFRALFNHNPKNGPTWFTAGYFDQLETVLELVAVQYTGEKELSTSWAVELLCAALVAGGPVHTFAIWYVTASSSRPWLTLAILGWSGATISHLQISRPSL